MWVLFILIYNSIVNIHGQITSGSNEEMLELYHKIATYPEMLGNEPYQLRVVYLSY